MKQAMMKEAVILGKRKAGLVDVPIPQPKADWALVKLHAAPMCNEYHMFEAGVSSRALGHESAGEVVEVAQPCGVEVGDRVVVMRTGPCGRCQYCRDGDFIHCQNQINYAEFTGSRRPGKWAQYSLGTAWLLPKIPDGVSYEHASMAWCGLGPTFGAFQSVGLTTYDTVLITGAGPVGLGGIVNARFRGARVIVVERIPWRVNRAKEMGVAAVLDPCEEGILEHIKDLTGGRGVDVALDSSGNVQAEHLCIDATRIKGKVAFVGQCRDDLVIHVSPDMINKGLTITGQWHYSLNDFPKIMKVIQESPLLDLLISHVMPMSRIQEALELSASHQCGKIILKPWE